MPSVMTKVLLESEFATLVKSLASSPTRNDSLLDLLREDHPYYDQRSAAAVVRMRGWVLLALARSPLPDKALLYVLEELDTGIDSYLVAAAARALRAYPIPHASFAPFVLRAITNIRYQDEPLVLERYGEYAESLTGTSPLGELLATLVWLGSQAQSVRAEIKALRTPPAGLAGRWWPALDGLLKRLPENNVPLASDSQACCELPSGLRHVFPWPRYRAEAVESIIFEDHTGVRLTFQECFSGQPSIVVFFYTRCDNPLKCSLTITKLARVQKLLEERKLSEQIRTAAITYDPSFDLPERLRVYGQDRSLTMNPQHRMLRVMEGNNALHEYFKLKLNFIESLVNRHRIEIYVLNADGQIAYSFERLHWDEVELVARANEVLEEQNIKPLTHSAKPSGGWRDTLPVLGTLASLVVAIFPKCPLCWAAYLSMFGIAGLEQIPYSPWLQPLLVVVVLINLASIWLRERTAGGFAGFYLATLGALAIFASKLPFDWKALAWWGVGLTLAGSLISVLRLSVLRLSLLLIQRKLR